MAVICIGVCSCFAWSFLFAVLANYWPGPFVDYWIDIPNVEKYFNGQLTFADLISAHANVHRLFIPRLLFIADYQFFSGSNVLLIGVSILCKVATLLLFNQLIKNQSLKIRMILNVILFAAIFNAANLSNVLHNSNLQWDLAVVFGCFAIYYYSQDIQATLFKRIKKLAIAYVFFLCGFLSQAGAIPVALVFFFISLTNKKWLESVLSLGFIVFILYLTFFILPINEPDKPTYEGALAMMIFKFKYVCIYIFKMFSGSTYFVDNQHFYFSWLMLGLFTLSLGSAIRTRKIYNNVFLNIALFTFLMMLLIASARVDFAPKTWSANRYQTNTLLFTLALSLHGFFSAPLWVGEKYQTVLRSLILAMCCFGLLIPQMYLNTYAFIFGNKIFNAQAYMLTHGVNQYNGADLLPSMQEHDRIAEPDPFFRAHGFAWYANKQHGEGVFKQTRQVGETFSALVDMESFAKTCQPNSAPMQYSTDPSGSGYAFSTPFTTNNPLYFVSLLSRNTYYILDEQGTVIGFSYLFINPENPYRNAEIRGYVSEARAKYMTDIDSAEHLHCLTSFHP